jgi:hypothetical protein
VNCVSAGGGPALHHIGRLMDAIPSMADAPFHAPPDVVLDLPPPVSVNKTRRIDWGGMKRAKNWRKVANGYLMMVRQRPTRIPRFEILIVLDEATVACDADNSAKMVIDYLRLIEIIEDDSPKHMRKVTIEWGHAPLGCRVTVRPCA